MFTVFRKIAEHAKLGPGHPFSKRGKPVSTIHAHGGRASSTTILPGLQRIRTSTSITSRSFFLLLLITLVKIAVALAPLGERLQAPFLRVMTAGRISRSARLLVGSVSPVSS